MNTPATHRPTGPYPILGMRRHTRKNGAPYLVAVLDRDLHLPAGSELHLRRLHVGASPEYALQLVPPRAALSQRDRAAAATDRLDGSAIRVDTRDTGSEPMP